MIKGRFSRGAMAEAAGVLALLLLFSVQVTWSSFRHSASFDEPANVAGGYFALTESEYRLVPANLPLVRMVATLPLLFTTLDPPEIPKRVDMATPWRLGYEMLYERNDGDRILRLCRLALLPIALLLGVGIYLWARQLQGVAAGMLAVALFCFEPNMLAHAAQFTTDLPLTCFLFLFFFGLYRVSCQVTISSLTLLCLGFAFSMLTKFTALPMLAVAALLWVLACSGARPLRIYLPWVGERELAGFWRRLSIFPILLFLMALSSWILVWGAYRFDFDGTAGLGLSWPRPWQDQAPEGALHRVFLDVTTRWRLLPESYLYAFYFNLKEAGTFPGYLFGEIRTGGWWYYFIVSLMVKTPPATLVLAAAGLGGLAIRKRAAWRKWGFAALPPLAFLLMLSNVGFNIGHRHLLPVYPFLFVAAGVGTLSLLEGRRRWLQAPVFLLLGAQLLSSFLVAPHYLAYFNTLAGGRDGGHEVLVDSNLDWGQELRELRTWMDREEVEHVWLSYFGTASPEYYGISCEYLPGYPPLGNATHVHPVLMRMPQLPRVPGVVVISATNLHGVYFTATGLPVDYYGLYRERTPDEIVGGSLFIYRNEDEEPEAAVQSP